jgi:SAM-dependent methyltransferase
VEDVAQQVYWECHDSHLKRRSPTHPVIAAFAQPKLNLAAQYGVFDTGSTVLEVGCGNGFFTQHFPDSVWVVGLDVSSLMLHLNPCERLSQGSALNLPFFDSSFDTLICSNLLHHLSDPLAAIREMKRVSRRFVILSEPNRNNPGMLLLGLIKPAERWSLKYTPGYLRHLVQRAGLSIKACHVQGMIYPNKTPAFALPFSKKIDGQHPFGAYTLLVAEKVNSGQ